MNVPKILIVDSDEILRYKISQSLTNKGYQVLNAANCAAADEISFATSIDVALVDLLLPDGSGMELLGRLNSRHRNIKTIALCTTPHIDSAVAATRKGAAHFIAKSASVVDEISQIVEALVSKQKAPSALNGLGEMIPILPGAERSFNINNRPPSSGCSALSPLPNLQLTPSVKSITARTEKPIVGQSIEMVRLLDFVNRVADSDSTILITGESGTGKELIARAIHQSSSRRSKPFIPINCGAIPSELLESELFGHIKGAFTGAINNRPGRFELANGGTVFLDEIGDMNPSLQVKLLRVLQERCFEPVGSTKTVEVSVRVIAATNMNLDLAVDEGRFREDLFYRLNVIPVHVPPLRERSDDIPHLLEYFLAYFNKSKTKNIHAFTPDSIQLLKTYSWPGNIRELENLVERLVILTDGEFIQQTDLPPKYRQATAFFELTPSDPPAVTSGPKNPPIDFNSAVDAYENSLILKALERTGWNRKQAAILLNLNRTTLVEKMKKKGLKPPVISC